MTTASHHDDTPLDALAAQVRTFPPLGTEETAGLLSRASEDRRGPAEQDLIHHNLHLGLKAAVARGGRGIEVIDLYQEAAIAVTVAVDEFVSRRGPAADLAEYVQSVVVTHLDDTLQRSSAMKQADEALFDAARELSMAEAGLRRQLARQPTLEELSELLGWTSARTEVISAILADARIVHDVDLIDYLDDES